MILKLNYIFLRADLLINSATFTETSKFGTIKNNLYLGNLQFQSSVCVIPRETEETTGSTDEDLAFTGIGVMGPFTIM